MNKDLSMVTLTIDGRPVTAPAGSTVLEAARQLGIEIPTLCHLPELPGHKPSCMVCAVRLGNEPRLVPACATRVRDGLAVTSEDPAIHAARRAALELFFGDHVGDCVAVCERICPAHLPIPEMLRLAAAGDLRTAAALARNRVVFPGVLGRICRAPCQNGCRRGKSDGPVAIRAVEGAVGDHALADAAAPLPACRPPSGRRIAMVGAGPAGLSAAFFLRQAGHTCVVFDDQPEPGGRLRSGWSEQELPRAVLDGEIAILGRMGIEFRPRMRLGHDMSLAELQKEFQAVILAVGDLPRSDAAALGVAVTERGLAVDTRTRQTNLPGVFAGGSAVRPRSEPVQSIGDGRRVAEAVDAFLAGRPAGEISKDFTCTIPALSPEEYRAWAEGSVASLYPGALSGDLAQAAGRCGQCDCRAAATCRLRIHAARYGVDPRGFAGERRRHFALLRQPGGVLYEPGKCIACGLCVALTARAREPLGLTFIGRGFDVKVGVPLDGALGDALQNTAEEVVRHCPTGALAFEKRRADDPG